MNPKDDQIILGLALIAMAGFMFGGCYTPKRTKQLVFDAYSFGWANGLLWGLKQRKTPDCGNQVGLVE